jgi:hypothetical protein
MAVPASVKKQAEEAARIQESIIANKTGKPVEQPAAAPSTTDPADDWEKRFKGLQKTHSVAQDEMSELRDTNTKLASDIAELKAMIKDKPDPEPAAQAPVFTDAEVKEYGQDFLEMVSRVASQASTPDSTIASELKEVKDRVNGFVEHQHQSDEDKFYSILDAEFPGWEATNESEGFKKWLAELMPLTGQQRQAFLEKAHKQFDAKAVLSFFAAYTGESGGSYSPRTVTASSELQDEVVDTDIYRASDIKRFYDEKARGHWAGREKEARQIELKIFAAQKQGRVR